MLDAQIEQFLCENEWVDGACISEIDKEAQTCRIQIEASQSGHRLIHDFGMQEFERRIQSHKVSLEFNEICWDICPFESAVSLKGVAQAAADFPPHTVRI